MVWVSTLGQPTIFFIGSGPAFADVGLVLGKILIAKIKIFITTVT